MRASWAILAATLLCVSLSGCSGNDDDDDANGGSNGGHLDVWGPIQALMAGVPCEAPVGAGESSNLVQLANVTYAEEAGMHAEVDVGGPSGNILLHARYATGGFEIVDIADPLHPKDLGYFTLDDTEGALDVKWSPDNQTALYGANFGIQMVDMRDVHNPVPAGEWHFEDAAIPTDPLPRISENSHMLYTARIADRDWVFLAPNSNTGIWILEMTGPPEARELTFVTQTLPIEGGPLGPHDMFVTQDTQDGNWYVYSADGFHGWTVFNVNDPESPQLAGGILNPIEGAYTHTLQAQWVNGRRLVATIGEVGANALKVYDATNLRAPIFLGAWQAVPGPGSTAPEHNFNVVGGKLYLSYYTLGMYVFDLSKLSGLPVLGTAELTPMAHWGNNPETAPGPLSFDGIWDTVLKDGVIYLSNIEGGLVVVGFGCNAVPDPTLTSTG